MYMYNMLDYHFNERKLMNTARKLWGLLSTKGTYYTGQEGITLIESTKIRWFSRWSGGGGMSLLSEAKSLKLPNEGHQAQVH